MQDFNQIVETRPAVPGDEDFLMHLFATTRPEFDLINLDAAARQALIAMQFNAQRIQYEESYPHADARIILRDGQSIGRILIDRSKTEIVLVDISLLPEYRNLGIGSRLIRQLIHEAGVTQRPIRLHVFRTNPAMRLYERLGFSRVANHSMHLQMVYAAR